jgi:hypothetical protein
VTTTDANEILTTAVTVLQRPAPRARFWLELRSMPRAAANTYSATAGDLWTDPGNETLGLAGVTPRAMSDLRDLVRVAPKWKPAGVAAMWAIVNLPGTTIHPEPSWERWSRLSFDFSPDLRAYPSRNPALRYVQLDALTYVPRGVWPTYVPLLGQDPTLGEFTSGDPTAATWGPFDLSVFGGSAAYTPSPVFVANVRLPDDGDTPE